MWAIASELRQEFEDMVSRSELGYLYRIWEDYRALHVSPIYLRAMQATRRLLP